MQCWNYVPTIMFFNRKEHFKVKFEYEMDQFDRSKMNIIFKQIIYDFSLFRCTVIIKSYNSLFSLADSNIIVIYLNKSLKKQNEVCVIFDNS